MNKPGTPAFWRSGIALVAILIMLVALLPEVPVAMADDAEVEIELKLGDSNGRGKGGNFKLPRTPFVSKGHFMAPLAAVANQLDCKVEYNAASKRVTLSRDGKSIVMTIGKTACLVNGVYVDMPIAPVANRGTTFVPIRFIVERLFDDVELDFKWGRLKIRVRQKHHNHGGQEEDWQRVAFEVVAGADLIDKEINVPFVKPVTRADLYCPDSLPQDAALLAVIRGWFSNTGYGIETRELVLHDGKLTVYVNLKNPSEDRVYSTVMTYASQVIRLKEGMPEYASWEIRTTANQLIGSSEGTVLDGTLTLNKLPGLHIRQDLRDVQLGTPTLLLGNSDSLLQSSDLPDDTPVLAAVWGWRNSSGYAIDVKRLELNNGKLVATVGLVAPAPGSFQLQALTWVDQILTIPKNMPAITGWEIRDQSGILLNSKALPSVVPFIEAENPDLSWVNINVRGVQSKLVTVGSEQKLLLVIKRGSCATGGYDIALSGLKVDAYGSVLAEVELHDPEPGAFVTQSVTYPLTAVYISPVFAGHQFNVENLAQPDDSWTNPVIVNLPLKAGIDKSERRVVTGYGRDLLANPGSLSDEFLVVVFRGECNSGGYSISVKEFVRVGGVVRVVVEEEDPAPGSMVTWALTYPYQIVKAPVGSEKLAFEMFPGNPEQAKFSLVAGTLKTGADVTERGAVWVQGEDLFVEPQLANEWFILVKRGFCPSSGYGLEVDRLQVANQTLQVFVTETNPGTGTMQSTVVTFPYLVLRVQDYVPRLPLHLIFID